MPPIKFGIKNTVRKKFVPGSSFVKSSASKNAKTFMPITDITANLTVNHIAFIKSLSSVNART